MGNGTSTLSLVFPTEIIACSEAGSTYIVEGELGHAALVSLRTFSLPLL